MTLIKIKNETVHLLIEKEWRTREVRKRARAIDLPDRGSAGTLLAQNLGTSPRVSVIETPP